MWLQLALTSRLDLILQRSFRGKTIVAFSALPHYSSGNVVFEVLLLKR